jgi:transglutaminase-like putative cysteine protease
MTWRLEVQHVTGYRYARDVLASYNEARLTPLSTAGQLTIDARLETVPPTRPNRYWDYWGSMVHVFDIHVPHAELIVSATCIVETPTSHEVAGPECEWAHLDGAAFRDEYYEYLAATAYVPADPELQLVAAGLKAQSDQPRDAVDLAGEWVRGELDYQKGSTSVSTSALEAWRSGRGVCQDFVHLHLAILRAMDIPARYVSGYFHPLDDAPIGDRVAGESHAWVEAWTGEWRPVDPTNAVHVGERHVMVARGRDYRDVTPLKGVYSGAPSSTPTVVVELTRRS